MRRESVAKLCMRIPTCILLGVVTLFGAQAQQEQQPSGKTEEETPNRVSEKREVQRIFEIKHADVSQLGDVLRIFGIPISQNRALKVISVTGPPDVVASVEDAIKRFDVPPSPVLASQNIEITAYLMVASKQTSASDTPQELAAVIKQLRGVFPYQGFRLLDTLVVRCRDGKDGSLGGIVPSTREEPVNATYGFSFKLASVTSDSKGRLIRIDGLQMVVRTRENMGTVGGTPETKNTIINTDVDLRENQKIVVGKATLDGSNNALFLVLTAKVVD